MKKAIALGVLAPVAVLVFTSIAVAQDSHGQTQSPDPVDKQLLDRAP